MNNNEAEQLNNQPVVPNWWAEVPAVILLIPQGAPAVGEEGNVYVDEFPNVAGIYFRVTQDFLQQWLAARERNHFRGLRNAPELQTFEMTLTHVNSMRDYVNGLVNGFGVNEMWSTLKAAYYLCEHGADIRDGRIRGSIRIRFTTDRRIAEAVGIGMNQFVNGTDFVADPATRRQFGLPPEQSEENGVYMLWIKDGNPIANALGLVARGPPSRGRNAFGTFVSRMANFYRSGDPDESRFKKTPSLNRWAGEYDANEPTATVRYSNDVEFYFFHKHFYPGCNIDGFVSS